MTQLLVDLYLDGYETQKEQDAACVEFVEESLDFSGSSVRAVLLPADLFLLLRDVRPYVEDMVGVASSARNTLWSLDEFLKLENK